MNAAAMINLVRKFTAQYGVQIEYERPVYTTNSRGQKVLERSPVKEKATVLLIKNNYNLVKELAALMGQRHDFSKYIIALPTVPLEKDMVIKSLADNMKYKTGAIDIWDISGRAVCKQINLIEVAA